MSKINGGGGGGVGVGGVGGRGDGRLVPKTERVFG